MAVASRASRTEIARFLKPSSVAIVGASAKAGALGRSVMTNLIEGGFSGQIHLVNPNQTEIDGRPCVASVDALPDGIDCAVLAIPQAGVIAALEACARKKVGGAVIFSAGFAEGGEQGRLTQQRIGAIAAGANMIVEGPNCLGFVNFVDSAVMTFVKSPARRLGDRRGVGIVSQSGAMATVVSVALGSRDLGLSYFVSTGNEAATGVEDYVDFLIADENTKTILLIVEQFRDPRRFLALAEQARAVGKPITLLHPGRSAEARKSAETHTGAMAGDYDVMRVKVARAGVCVVDTIEELLDVTELLHRLEEAPRGGVAVLGESGAFKALTLDFAESVGLALPPLAQKTEQALRSFLPDFIGATNPMDLTAQGLVDRDLYRKTLPPLLADEQFGAIVMGIILTDAWTSELKLPPIIETIATLKPEKAVIFAGLDEGADVPRHYVEQLRTLGVPFFPTTERVLRALARIGQIQGPPPPEAEKRAPPTIDLPAGVAPEYMAKRILGQLGVPTPAGMLCATLEQATQTARDVGFPVALKAQSASLSHKSEAGGVILNVADEKALAEGWARLHANVGEARPGLNLDGVLVEGMGARGLELIVGARADPDWGPVLLIGLGGVLSEALRDVRLLPAEMTQAEIAQEMFKLKGAALLRGFRGAPAVDVGAAAAIAATLGALMRARPELKEVDINPLVVYETGAVALDALMVTSVR